MAAAATQQPVRPVGRNAVLAVFFLFGAGALVYEIIWARMLGLVFGNTSYAVSTVLAAFMAGLGLGSWYFGGKTGAAGGGSRAGAPGVYALKAFAVLTFLAGICAALTPLLFDLARLAFSILPAAQYGAATMYGVTVQTLPPSAPFFFFTIAFCVLLLPTALLGGALPLLTEYLALSDSPEKAHELPQDVSRPASFLYSADTLGSAAGALLTGYVLIRYFGERASLAMAVILHLAVSIYVLFRLKEGVRAAELWELLVPSGRGSAGPGKTAILLLAAASGFAALAYEVLWTRALSLVLGSSTYAFTVILCAFLCGIAIGSALYYRFLARPGRAGISDMALFAIIQAATGLSAALLAAFFDALPLLYLRMLQAFGGGFAGSRGAQFLTAFLPILVPAVLSGAALPLAAKIYGCGLAERGGQGGERPRPALLIGNVYFSNTAGAVLGSIAAGFILLPVFGLQKGLFLAVIVNLAAAGLAFYRSGISGRRKAAALLLLACFAGGYAYLAPAWNERVMNSAPYYYAPNYLRQTSFYPGREKEILKTALNSDRVLFSKDGRNFVTAVKRTPYGTLALSIDGKIDASNVVGGDMESQVLIARLPALFNPAPADALVVGLASGITLGEVLKTPGLERADCVEIEPAMIEASGYFREWNGSPLGDPRATLIIDDARRYLSATEKKYDIIISEPSNPTVSGCSPLFTREYYEAARRRLKPGGVFCAWLQLYGLGPEEYRVVVKTLASVFPHVSVWRGSGRDTLLVASVDRAVPDYAALREGFAAGASSFRAIGITGPVGLLSRFCFDEGAVAGWKTGVNSDDHPGLEFVARFDNSGMLPETRGMFRGLLDLPLWMGDFNGWAELGDEYMSSGYYEQAEKLSLSGLIPADSPEGYALSGRLLIKMGMLESAVEKLQKAVKAGAGERAYADLAETYFKMKKLEEAGRAVDRALRAAPGSYRAYNLKGLLHTISGRYGDAIVSFRKAVDLKPDYFTAYSNLAEIYIDGTLEPWKAVELLEEAVKMSPDHALVYFQLGRAFFRVGDMPASKEMFMKAALYDSGMEARIRKFLAGEERRLARKAS